MPEFPDMAYQWMKSLSRLLKYKVVIKDCTALAMEQSLDKRFHVHTSLDSDHNLPLRPQQTPVMPLLTNVPHLPHF